MAQSCNFFKQVVEKAGELSNEQKSLAERSEYELKQKMLLQALPKVYLNDLLKTIRVDLRLILRRQVISINLFRL